MRGIFGYKNHINADTKTKLINNYSVTNASTHDSVELENLVSETDNILRHIDHPAS